jgi:hypothetical protein
VKLRLWLLAAFAIALLACLAFTQALANLFSLFTREGFFIPSQSSIFTFHTTVENSGSGEWWIYGEDHHYFYALPARDGTRYLAFPKANQSNNVGFQPNDYNTWLQESTISSPIP